MTKRPLILVTNDDGYDSAGIIELAYHLYELGDILFVAPATHHSGVGRGIPFGATATGEQGALVDGFGKIDVRTLDMGDNRVITTYAVHGTPALAAAHGYNEIADRKVDLCVSGINYGENVGRALNYSGTIGAALEAADVGIPSIAVSLQLDFKDMFYLKGDRSIFSVAARAAKNIAQQVLESETLPEFYCLNVNIPDNATDATPFEMAHQSCLNRWHWKKPVPRTYSEPFAMGYGSDPDVQWDEGSDCQVLLVKRHISVTPLSWCFEEHEELNRKSAHACIDAVNVSRRN